MTYYEIKDSDFNNFRKKYCYNSADGTTKCIKGRCPFVDIRSCSCALGLFMNRHIKEPESDYPFDPNVPEMGQL